MHSVYFTIRRRVAFVNYHTTLKTTIKTELLIRSQPSYAITPIPGKAEDYMSECSVYQSENKVRDRKKEFVPPLSIRPMCSTIENQSEKRENETLAVPRVIFWAYESIFWFRADITCYKMDFILVQKRRQMLCGSNKVSLSFTVSRSSSQR